MAATASQAASAVWAWAAPLAAAVAASACQAASLALAWARVVAMSVMKGSLPAREWPAQFAELFGHGGVEQAVGDHRAAVGGGKGRRQGGIADLAAGELEALGQLLDRNLVGQVRGRQVGAPDGDALGHAGARKCTTWSKRRRKASSTPCMRLVARSAQPSKDSRRWSR
jgi:hypothetical protein